jgi:hypothetical protein
MGRESKGRLRVEAEEKGIGPTDNTPEGDVVVIIRVHKDGGASITGPKDPALMRQLLQGALDQTTAKYVAAIVVSTLDKRARAIVPASMGDLRSLKDF